MGPFQQQILRWIPPTWRSTATAGALAETFGASLDSMAERTFLGRLAAIPYAGKAKTAGGILLQCEPDVLPWHARDRQIKLYSTEPLASKRWRLAHWRQLHARRGTHRGEIENVRPYFLGTDGTGSVPTIRIVHRNATRTTWHSIDPSGVYTVATAVDNFDYRTGDDAQWSQFYVIIEMSQSDYDSPPRYGDGHLYGDGSLYGVGSPNGLSVQGHADLIAMVLDWKSEHSWLAAVVLNWGPPIDVTSTGTQDADGWWSLPTSPGVWYPRVDPSTGFGRRPPYMQWIYQNLP